MADKNIFKAEKHIKIKKRIRKTVIGTAKKPRLSVFRSLKHIYAQLIDDDHGKTLAQTSTLSKAVMADMTSSKKGKTPVSKIVGTHIAKLAKEKGIETVVFDRGGYKYHGRIKALAEGAREGGLKF
jgi:large subunit ribosomal protein L18